MFHERSSLAIEARRGWGRGGGCPEDNNEIQRANYSILTYSLTYCTYQIIIMS